MRIFEFQFNPKASHDRFFRVFSFEPPQEMPELGSMVIVGELANALPTNAALLDRLAALLQKEYYAPEKQPQSPSQNLKSALKKANNFLKEETKKGNVDWLGNLHFLLLLLLPVAGSRDSALYFTKVGGTKLWIARDGSLVDAGKGIESAREEEDSVRVFGNVGSGKVVPGDRIMGLTAEVFDFFSKDNFLQTAVQLKEEKQFKSIFKAKHKEMSTVAGVLLFVIVEAFAPLQEGSQRLPSLSQWKVPAFPALRQIFRKARIQLPVLGLRGRLHLPRIPGLQSLSPALFTKTDFSSLIASGTQKRMSLLALLLFVLLLGFAIFGGEARTKNEKTMQESLPVPNSTELEELEIAVDLPSRISSANLQNVIQRDTRFYFFGPRSSKIFLFDTAGGTSEVFDVGENLLFGTSFGDSLLFFAQPNTIVELGEANTFVQHADTFLFSESQFGGMEQFAGNLYFFDARNGEIFKLPLPLSEQVSFERWVSPLSPKKPINAQSMSIDGSIWILTSENEIQRYFKGVYEESLGFEISPPLHNARSLKTNSQLPYLYISEPAEKRIVILTKSGQVLTQYVDPRFAQMRDFNVSADGHTLHLFDGTKLYRLPVSI